MRPSFSFSRLFGGRFSAGRRSVTIVIVALLGFGALLSLLFPSAFADNIRHLPGRWDHPWTFLTYPLAVEIGNGLFGAFFAVILLFWVYSIGISLESDLGQNRYLALWGVATVVPALLLTIPGVSAPAFGPLLPISVLTAVWAARNAEAQVLAMALFPLQAKWIAAITAVGVFATYFRMSLPASVVALIPMGIGWLWATEKIPGLSYRGSTKSKPSKAERAREMEFERAVGSRKTEREEKERLRRLLEGPSSSDRDGL